MTEANSKSGILRRVVTVLGARAIDLPTRYGMHLIVAAKLGVVQSGLFYIMFSAVTLAAGLGRIGLDRAATRDIAHAIASGDLFMARRIAWRTLAMVGLASIVVAALIASTAQPVARHLIGEPALTLPLVLGAFAIVPLCLSVAAAGILAGLQRIGWSQMIYAWGWPLLFCIVALVAPLTVTSATVALLAATTINAAVGIALAIAFLPAARRGDQMATPPSVKAFLGLGLSLFTTELFQLLLAAVPTLVIGALADARAAGLYALAWRIALVLNLLVVAIAAMAAPRFAALHARGEDSAIADEASRAVKIVMALGLPVLIVLFSFPATALSLLGEGFGDGAAILRVLLIGQLAAMVSVATPDLLGMTGHVGQLRRINGLSIAVLFVTLVMLTSVAGAFGAAIAVSLTLALNAVTASLMARRIIGHIPAARILRRG